MNVRLINLVFISTIALASLLHLNLANAAPPEKVNVTGAVPNAALQGESLEVVISGSGFGHGAQVRYLVSGTRDDSQIAVSSVVYNAGDDTLTTTIQVAAGALISDYDIEVQALSGRKGKGTTLFSVFSSNGGGNPDLSISCDELFGFTPGTCTAEGTDDPCEFIMPSNSEGSWQMNQDCDTQAMLVLGADFRFLTGRGHRLNLVAPWSGDYAGISNYQGANRIADIHIRVSDPAVAGGCDVAGKVQAAIFFDPDLGERSGMPRGNLYGITVEAQGGARFCNAIEYVGSDPYIGNPYKEAGVKSSHIMANSYARFGIWMANINLSDLNDQVKNEFARIQDNVVEASDSPCATAVLVGPHVERPRIDDNLVFAPSGAGCAGRTVGIAVLDSGRPYTDPVDANYDFLSARTTALSGNTVHTGGDGSIGVLVDDATDAEMTNSQVTAGDGGDFAVCVETGADFAEVKKASNFVGFDPGNEVVSTADCGAALP